MALFGVKLHGKQIVPVQSGYKLNTVVAGRGYGGGIIQLNIVAVHEIKTFVLCYAVPQGVIHHPPYGVPTHVRHFEPFAALAQ